MFLAAAQGEDPAFSRSGISLMGVPHYFLTADPDDSVIDKLNPNVMHNQVAIASKLMVLMDRLRTDQLNGNEPITKDDLFGI
jgi:hypothetical protein